MSACDNIRGRLDSYLSHELPEETVREVQQHLATCPHCTAEFEQLSRLKTRLQTAVRCTPVPDTLEQKVRQTLHKQRSIPGTGLWAVAAAAVVIISAGLIGFWRPTKPEDAILRKTTGRLAAVLNVGLRDHLQCAVFRKYPKQRMPSEQMAGDLGPQFAPLAPLVEARVPAGYHIVQAHICGGAGGREFTHFIMAGGGKLVSLILTRALPGESLKGGIYQTGVDRFQVVAFQDRDYLAYVISDMDAQDSLQWAASLAPAVREYLSDHTG